MTPKEKIAKILSQKNYSVVKCRVHRYDVLDDKFKPVPVSGNRIPLVRDGSVVEIFNMNDVLSVIDGLNGAAKKDYDIRKGKKFTIITIPVNVEAEYITGIDPIDFAPSKNTAKKIKIKKKKAPVKKKVSKIRSEEIKYIRDNYLSISINKMAIKLGVGRLTVGYIVKQIKAGKTLKYENK